MPETTIPDKYAGQVPRFVLPPELTNAPAEAVKEDVPEAPSGKATEAVAPEKEPEKQEVKEPSEGTTGTDPEKQSTRRFERRIDRATRRAAEAQARAELLERENAELKGRITPATPTGAPRLEDFTNVEEWGKAYATFEKDNALKDYQQKQSREAQQVAQAQLAQGWEGKASRGISRYDDFEEVVGDLKPTTPWAIAIMEAENGEDIAHFLGTHEKETRRILALSPIAQIREIGKLEATLAMKTEAPKTPSKAPPPIAPVTGGAAPSDNEIKAQMPYEEYMKVRKKALGAL